MQEKTQGYFIDKIYNKKQRRPLSGQLELTYRCNLNCVHCYCKGSEDKKKELTTFQWKKIINEIYKEGCLFLCFTGGEPLIREDFWEIYAYAKQKGFIITIFTNSLFFNEKIIRYLEKSPPFALEITLNGITKNTYEAITQVKGSFERAMGVIKKIAKMKLPLIIKSNCLKQNKNEISKIKEFTDRLLGKRKNKWKFKYDPMIYARLNQDTAPCKYRLSSQELLAVKRSEPEIWRQYEKGLCFKAPKLKRGRDFLYQCTSWYEQFFINPYGRLKFCEFSDKFSVDLKQKSFKEGFYNTFPQVLREKFKTDSKCKFCDLRPFCNHCPAKAYLEIGNEEAPVEYFCNLAKVRAEEMRNAQYASR